MLLRPKAEASFVTGRCLAKAASALLKSSFDPENSNVHPSGDPIGSLRSQLHREARSQASPSNTFVESDPLITSPLTAAITQRVLLLQRIHSSLQREIQKNQREPRADTSCNPKH